MSISNPNVPKSILALRSYSAQTFLRDLLAGITVGLVALPLAMAFGIASGVTPQAGLYTAVVAGFLISALGGSRTQIGGPTGAFVVIVAGIVARFGMSGLAMVTLMAGILLVAMGMTGFGAAVRFIPRMVVIGFTNGIAILIASTQIKDLFGLRTGAVPSEFLPRMKLLTAHFATVNWAALGLGFGALVIMLALPRFTKRVPASIIAVLVCAGASLLLNLPVETIGSRFGGIPQGLPPFAIPDFHAEHILPLIPSAFTVALLAALESMLSAVVADGMTGDRHNPNVELVAQGIANITSPLFGGIPATGPSHAPRRISERTRVLQFQASCTRSLCCAFWLWRLRWPATFRSPRWPRCFSWWLTTWESGTKSALSCNWMRQPFRSGS